MAPAEQPPETPNQTNIHGDLNTAGGLVNTGTINTGGAPVIGRDQIIIQQRLNPADLRNQRNHAVLRQAVRRFWIDGVLKGSLYNEVCIRLGLDARPEAVDNRPWKLTLHQTGQPDRTIPDDKEIVEIFDEMGQQLLILGEPGSGKTTTLLALAEKLLARSEIDEMSPTPVVFNLSSWAERGLELDSWLMEELNLRYQIPQKVAAKWVYSDELLILLDGLDEVVEDRRLACIAAINRYRRQYLAGLVVCSRTKEYTKLKRLLKLSGAVTVLPLTMRQIESYLAYWGVHTTALRIALQVNNDLRNLASTPLMLSVMVLAYQDENSINRHVRNKRDELAQIFDHYINRMFKHREVFHSYPPQQTALYLRRLATQMSFQGQTLFLIENLQPDWLADHSLFNWYRLASGLITGTLVWILFGLLVGMVKALVFGIFFAILVERFTGLDSRIRAYKVALFSWQKGLGFGLVFGTLGAVLGWLSAGVTYTITGGLCFAIIAFLLFGQASTGETYEPQSQPNFGIWRALRNGLLFGLNLGLFAGISIGLLNGVLVGSVVGLSFGLFGGLVGDLFRCIQHVILRIILYQEKSIPGNYARFLDYAASRLFLRKVGGGYVFVHRLIMEHFASLTDEDIARITAGLEQS